MSPYAYFTAALILSAGISLLLAWLAWPRRDGGAGRAFAWLAIAIALWCGTSALDKLVPDVETKVFLAKLQYLGIASVSPFWLQMTLGHSRMDARLTPRALAVVWLIPALTIVIAFTNELHGLLWTHVTPPATRGRPTVFHHGVWFWVSAGYCYFLLAVGCAALARSVVRFPQRYKSQSCAMLIGASLPWLANALYLSRAIPVPGLDLTPVAFALTGLSYGWGLVRDRLFELRPIARDTLVEHMTDGVLVLDGSDRIVDVNPAAQALLERTDPGLVGASVREVFTAWTPTLADPLPRTGLELRSGDRFLDLKIVPMRDGRRREVGRLLVLRDVTRSRRTEAELRSANERLEDRLAEIQLLQAELREQAIRDPLTGLVNRRFLEEYLRRELERAQDRESAMAVVLLDIDHFKRLNDTFGHKAGDRVLVTLANVLQERTGPGEQACRYGGEEFVVVLPGVGAREALWRADEWRRAFADTPVECDGRRISATVSLGIAFYPEHGSSEESLIHAADEALYSAKACGRNVVRVAGPARVAAEHPHLPGL